MRHRTKIAIIVASCVLITGAGVAYAAPMIYRSFFVGTPAKVPSLMAEDSALDPKSGDPLDPAALSGTWKVADGSEAGYRLNEVLNGTDVTVTGRTPQVSGAITTKDLSLTKASLTVDVASIATDQPARDSYFRDQALHASEHPTATFTLTKPVTAASTPKSGKAADQKVAGELTIAGVTKPVTFTVQMKTDGETAEVAGRIPITFADFGVEAPSLGFVKVEPQGFVEFELNLTKQ